MKKLALLFIGLASMMSLAGCGSSDTGGQGGNKSITEIYISNNAVNYIEVDETLTLYANVTPTDATGSFTWKVSDTSVVSLTSGLGKATVKGLKVGSATVYALSDNNVKSNVITINVTPFYQIKLDGDQLGFSNGKNTGEKNLTINNITYKVKYQNVYYETSGKNFYLTENTNSNNIDGGYPEPKANDSYIFISGMEGSNTASANSCRKIKFTAASSQNGTLFKAHSIYKNGNNGTYVSIKFSNSNISETGISGSQKIDGEKFVATDDGVNVRLSSIEIRVAP